MLRRPVTEFLKQIDQTEIANLILHSIAFAMG